MFKLFSGLGDSNEKEIRKLEPLVKRINELESTFATLSDDELKAQTAAAFLKEYHGNGCEDPAVQPFCDSSCPIRDTTNEARARSA